MCIYIYVCLCVFYTNGKQDCYQLALPSVISVDYKTPPPFIEC